MNCPNCQHKIIAEDIDIQLEILHCHHCEQETFLYDLVPSHPVLQSSKFELRYQPKGITLHRDSLLSIKGSHYHIGKAALFGSVASMWTIGGASFLYYTDFINQWDFPLLLFGLLFYTLLVLVFIGLTISTVWGYTACNLSDTELCIIDNMQIVQLPVKKIPLQDIDFLEAKIAIDRDGHESCSIMIHTKDINPLSNPTVYVELSAERCRYVVDATNRILYYIEQGLPLCLNPDLLANLVSKE